MLPFTKSQKYLFFSLALILLANTSQSDEDQVTEVFKMQEQYFKDINTLDITITFAQEFTTLPPQGNLVTQGLDISERLRMDGARWRIDRKSLSHVSNPDNDERRQQESIQSFSFDGEVYQKTNRDGRTVYSASNPMPKPSRTVQKLFLKPFYPYFLDKEISDRLHYLKGKDAWVNLIEESKYVGVEDVIGHTCTVIDVFPENNPDSELGINRKYRIYCAEDFANLPLRTEIYIDDDSGSWLFNVTDVDEIVFIQASNKQIPVIVAIHQESFEPSGKSIFSSSASADSDQIHINDEIESEIFSLFTDKVSTFIDNASPEKSFTLKKP